MRRRVKTLGADVLLAGRRLSPRRLVVVAVGKAAARMIGAAHDTLGDRADGLLAVDAAAHPVPERVRRLVAGHPLPDARGLHAAREVERIADGLGADDVLLLLLSGGASALLPAPADGVALADKAATTALLLRSGATIQEVNVVRRHLSRLKGGGLLRHAAPAQVVTLALSDVVGDDPAAIGSGPTAADPSTFDDARRVLERRRLWRAVPAAVRRHLEAGCKGRVQETLAPGDPLLRRARFEVLAGSRTISAAVGAQAARLGVRARLAGHALTGEARRVARRFVAKPGACVVGAGETTVHVRGDGVGGRNQEMAVAAAAELARAARPAVAAFLATDGVDGPTAFAGGIVDDTTVLRARARPSCARARAPGQRRGPLAGRRRRPDRHRPDRHQRGGCLRPAARAGTVESLHLQTRERGLGDERDPSAEERAEDEPAELPDTASLAEPPPAGPAPRDGFDAVDLTTPPERDLNYIAFEQRARLAEDRLAEVLSGYRQLKTETEEHRVRITKNVERRFEQRHEKLMLKFIDILDNFDRALDSSEQSYAGESLIQGLILVRTQLLQTLKDEGLERIPVLGREYDPHVSEAIGTAPVAEQDKDNVVVKELLRGYRLNGRVARAGRVIIGKWEAPPPPEPPAVEEASPPEDPIELVRVPPAPAPPPDDDVPPRSEP